MPDKKIGKKARQIMLGLWIGSVAIVIAGSLANADTLERFGGLAGGHDKIGHFLAYTVLTLLPGLIFRNPSDRIITALTMMILGGALELAQRFVPGRSSDPADMITNICGVLAGYLFSQLLRETPLVKIWLAGGPDEVARRS